MQPLRCGKVGLVCTLIVGRDVVAPGTLLLAANRDENPRRPSAPPGVLVERPRVVGGRDLVAGGTWLAIRETLFAVALLNRRPAPGSPDPPGTARRSRGALTMDVAAVDERFADDLDPAGERRSLLERLRGVSGGGLPHAALSRAFAALWEAPAPGFAPFTLVFASPAASWLLTLDPEGPGCRPIPSGWHVLTHTELDDPEEPRTARLLAALAGFAPRSAEQAEQRLGDLLRSHGDAANGVPPVCLHDGPMPTVSSATVWLAAGAARYRHAEGRPCEHALRDVSALLLPAGRLA